jgi:hypothetical protein
MYNTAYIHFGSMRFGVILCPQCKTARGIMLGSKTTSCVKCGKKINLKKARLLVKVRTESDLAEAVGKINMKLGNGEEDYQTDLKMLKDEKEIKRSQAEEPKNIYDRIAARLSEVPGRDNRIKASAKEIYSEIGEFTEKDFFEVLKRTGFKEGDELRNYLRRLLENDIIYEPKNGLYRCVEE